MSNIAIVGFGRIGRTALKRALSTRAFTPVAISDVHDVASLAALFAVDTNYGRWHEPVRADGDRLIIGDREIRCVDASKSPPDWGALGVDLVVECTGRATKRAGAQAHLDRGARRVLVSAPSKSLEDSPTRTDINSNVRAPGSSLRRGCAARTARTRALRRAPAPARPGRAA